MPAAKQPRSALQEGVRLLAIRPLTSAELLSRLVAGGHDQAEAVAAEASLRDQGYLNDLALARHYLVVRADRKGHGPVRLISELVRRGVAPETASEALRQAVQEGELDPEMILEREARKRVEAQGGHLDRKRYARVYNALLRSGYEPYSIRGVLERYLNVSSEDAARRAEDDV